MINHLRTLLINRSGSPAGFINRPGEEFIPPSFRPVALPASMTSVRRTLYGHQPDGLFENYRTRQYLAILHSTELAEFVTELDPRITYDVNNPDLFQGVFGTRVDSGDRALIRLIGTPLPPDHAGQSDRRWRITVLDEASARVERLYPNYHEQVVAVAETNDWSDIVPLHGNSFGASFHVTPGEVWQIEDRAKPTRSLGEIVARLEQANLLELFGDATAKATQEPWMTFRNLWYGHKELPYRLGGLLLALAYQTEERRSSG